MAYRILLITSGNDISREFAHIRADEPRFRHKFGGGIGQVSGYYAVKQTFLVSVAEFFQAAGEQTEGGDQEDTASAEFLQFFGNGQHRLAGGDDVVGYHNVQPFDGVADVFVGDDGVTTVEDHRIVAAFVEHTQVYAQYGSVVDVSVERAFVGAYHHKVIFVEREIFEVFKQGFHHLIGGHKVVETDQRGSVLHSGVVSVESDYFGNAQVFEFSQHHRAVQRFSRRTSVLSAAVEYRHDYRDLVGFTAHRRNNSLEIGVMIVGAHRYGHTEHIVSYAVISHVAKDINIFSSYRFLNERFAVARSEAGINAFDYERIDGRVDILSFRFLVIPFRQIFVYFAGEVVSARQSDDPEFGLRKIEIKATIVKSSHKSSV